MQITAQLHLMARPFLGLFRVRMPNKNRILLAAQKKVNPLTGRRWRKALLRVNAISEFQSTEATLFLKLVMEKIILKILLIYLEVYNNIPNKNIT